MQSIGWVLFGTAMVLVVLHRDAAKRYLAAYERVHRGRPGAEWLVRRDPDPDVERLRLRRLLVVIPASVFVMAGVALLAYAPR